MTTDEHVAALQARWLAEEQQRDKEDQEGKQRYREKRRDRLISEGYVAMEHFRKCPACLRAVIEARETPHYPDQ
jgi:hypothetical protein